MPPPGQYNSSLTRVRPVFEQLIAGTTPSEDWLRALLAIAPHQSALPAAVLAAPGHLGPESTAFDAEKDRLKAFEYPAPAPKAFLRWLVDHPTELTWPIRSGKRAQYSTMTMAWREALIDNTGSGREAAQAEARAVLDGKRSQRAGEPRWWEFEGRTSVDCCLQTSELVLFVEGKRTEALSMSTDWFPRRNQLIRNLEAIGELAGNRACGVLLVGETPIADPTAADYAASLPHLNATQRDEVRRRYLGAVTWQDVCRAVNVPYAALPHTTPPRPRPSPT